MSTSDSNNIDSVTTEANADFDLSEAQLRLAAQAFDNGEATVELPESNHGDSTAKAQVKDTPSFDASKGASAGENSQSTNNAEHQGVQGVGVSDPSQSGESLVGDSSGQDSSKSSIKGPDEKPESNYSKAKKNAERYDRNWRRLQEGQAELARARAELAAREAAFQQGSQSPAQPTQANVAQQGDAQAQRYLEAAAAWESEGKFDLAELARGQAALLRSQTSSSGEPLGGGSSGREPVPAQSPAHAQVQQVTQAANGPPPVGSPAFIAAWNENLRSLEADADFAELRDRDSALFKATAGVLQEEARLSYYPDGIRVAARIAKLRVQAEAVPTLRTKVQAQEQELAKLRAATSPSRGSPNSRGGAKSFEDMSTADQERELLRMAQEVDGV